MNVCFFTPQGCTFTFKNIEIVQDNEQVFQFNYVAMSDGKAKQGTMYKANIIGLSITP